MDARVEKVFKLPLFQRVLLLGLLVAVIIGLFVYLAYLPALEKHASLVRQNESLTAKLQQDQRIANNLPKFKAEYEKMQQRLEDALMELPNEKEIPTLLTNIGGLAKESGLEIQLFKPQEEVTRGFYAEVPVTLKLVGNYHEMGMFAYQVGKLSRIVNLTNLQLKSQKSDSDRAQLGIDCTAVTFRFLPQDKDKK
jgi:type IV pilus assembly protein PilO